MRQILDGGISAVRASARAVETRIMIEEKPKPEREQKVEEKSTRIPSVEVGAEKPKSFIIDITTDNMDRGLIFTGAERPQ